MTELNEPRQPVTEPDARQALIDIEAAGQEARQSAQPSLGYRLLVCASMVALFALQTIPDELRWLETTLSIVFALALGTSVMWTLANKRVVAKRIWPAKYGLVPAVIAVAPMVGALLALDHFRESVPWWAVIGVGVVLAAGLWFLTDWSWRRWIEAGRR